MALIWGDRRKGPNPNRSKDRGSFQEHAEAMQAFRLSHPMDWRHWGQKTTGGLAALIPLRVGMPTAYQMN